jgi:ATP-dependent RNA helicase RhlE
VEIFVLDEADRMLDMGFMKDIKKILPLLPKQRHNLFFSATMPPEIQTLANSILVNPQRIEVTPPATTVEKIKRTVMFVEKKDKLQLLVHLLKNKNLNKVLVFVEMKHFANKVVEKLLKNGISAAAIHGNKSQGARQRALEDFTHERIRVLVATDIASRGIDIDGISHVINFELSNIIENYVHRIGRTARAGTEGDAITLCTAEEKSYLHAIEKATNQKIEVITDQPYHSEEAAQSHVMSVGKAKAQIEGRRSDNRRPDNRRPRFHRAKKKNPRHNPARG